MWPEGEFSFPYCDIFSGYKSFKVPKASGNVTLAIICATFLSVFVDI